jgi:eukaryotic-like serine/threonine-protein kinase
MSEDERSVFDALPVEPPAVAEPPATEAPAAAQPAAAPEPPAVPEPAAVDPPAVAAPPGAIEPPAAAEPAVAAEPPAAPAPAVVAAEPAVVAEPPAPPEPATAAEPPAMAELSSDEVAASDGARAPQHSEPIELVQRVSRPARAVTGSESETLYALEEGDVSEARVSDSAIPIELDRIESRPPPMSITANYIGTTIDGRYRVESLLGEGGMGFVYRCRHKVLDRLVAIKILRQDVPRARVVMERFVLEAKAASAIGNAHIVDVLDFGELPDGSTYFVMEFLEGRSLADVMDRERPIAEELIVSLARQIAEGLGAAHVASIVHRDLKPDNVFLVERHGTRDFVKILDFGIAKIGTAQSKITRAGEIFGTPHYMAPEQAKGSTVDHRADIYALGVILFELITGHVPFDSETPFGVLTQHISADPPPPSALNPRVTPGLEAIVLKCLAKKPEQRYASMTALIEELDRLGRGAAPLARRELTQRAMARTLPSSIPPPFRSAGRRWPLYLGVLLLAGGASALYVGTLSPRGSVPKVIAGSRPAFRGEMTALAQSATAAAAERKVALVLAPIDAHVFKKGEDLGAMPVTLSLAPGDVVTVEVKRQGFFTRKLKIDGKKSRVIVRLVPIPGVKPAVPVPATPEEVAATDQPEPIAEAKPSAETAAEAPIPAGSAVQKPPTATESAPKPAEDEPGRP